MRALVLLLALSISSFAAEGWSEDFPAALSKAKVNNQPILLDFTGSDWCGWCVKLDQEVFSQKEFAEWAKDRVQLVTVDFPHKRAQAADVKSRNNQLQEKYGIDGYPTIVIVDTSGKELGRLGYQPGGPKAWTAAVDAILAKAK